MICINSTPWTKPIRSVACDPWILTPLTFSLLFRKFTEITRESIWLKSWKHINKCYSSQELKLENIIQSICPWIEPVQFMEAYQQMLLVRERAKSFGICLSPNHLLQMPTIEILTCKCFIYLLTLYTLEYI